MSKDVKTSVLLVHGQLLKVDSAVQDKEMVHRLIFKVEVYDKGLEEDVPKSIAIKLSPDHNEYADDYKAKVGSVISVPISFVSIGNDTYYRTAGDGKMLNLVQDKPVKVVSTT